MNKNNQNKYQKNKKNQLSKSKLIDNRVNYKKIYIVYQILHILSLLQNSCFLIFKKLKKIKISLLRKTIWKIY